MSVKKEDSSMLEQKEKARLIMDYFHRLVVHHGLWFAEVKHQMGMERALDMLLTASERSLGLQMKHLGDLLGFSMVEGIPSFLLDLPDEKLEALKDRMAKNWLANDGIWFQAVENEHGMNDAKRCNDSCWAQFSPVEARLIARLLGLSLQPGLDGLKKALSFRLYATINVQSFSDETPTGFVFRMNNCRVQEARKRKGLADYPCKSGGLVEYAYFARTIDARIKTECLGCPPDSHPDEWFCAWKFTME